MRREQGHTLQTTALVNEAYLKLAEQAQVDWQYRSRFLGAAARLMRHTWWITRAESAAAKEAAAHTCPRSTMG